MQVNWNKDNENKGNRVEVGQGGYEEMMKERKRKLPEMQAGIQDALDSWNGQNICIVVMLEDENGLPDGCHLVMTGLARPEMQLGLAKSLDKASTDAITSMIDGVKDNPRMLIELAKQIMEDK